MIVRRTSYTYLKRKSELPRKIGRTVSPPLTFSKISCSKYYSEQGHEEQ